MFAEQCGEQVGGALPHYGSNRARLDRQFEFAALRVDDPHAIRQRSRQVTSHDAGQRQFAAPAGFPTGYGGISGENACKGLWRSRHGAASEVGRVRAYGQGALWRRCI